MPSLDISGMDQDELAIEDEDDTTSEEVLGKQERVVNVEANFFTSERTGNLMLTDPEGFDYIRGKNRGHWSSWVCRTHKNNGCKATAVTKGSILEKLFGTHHHIEKVHGNKKAEKAPRKSRAKAAKAGDDSARVLNVPAVFVRGSRGSAQLQDPEGFHYIKNRQRGNLMYWYCKKFRNQGCRATAITKGFTLVKITKGHTNHHIEKVHGNSGRRRAPDGSWVKSEQIALETNPVEEADS